MITSEKALLKLIGGTYHDSDGLYVATDDMKVADSNMEKKKLYSCNFNYCHGICMLDENNVATLMHSGQCSPKMIIDGVMSVPGYIDNKNLRLVPDIVKIYSKSNQVSIVNVYDPFHFFWSEEDIESMFEEYGFKGVIHHKLETNPDAMNFRHILLDSEKRRICVLQGHYPPRITKIEL